MSLTVILKLQRSYKAQNQKGFLVSWLLYSSSILMGTDVTEAVKKLPSPCDIKVHSVMCTKLIKLVDRVYKLIPRCSDGINSLCSIISSIDEAKLLVQDCCESSKLYLALSGKTVLSRCIKLKDSLEQGLSKIQTMVPIG
ncbi:hypothetical protein L1987_35556 [Smallanthus sonchifolius]|uniref:Uncharacterized protein n=1 Tax=Smallanthus sonchifolius TaxID=185202 RepID=A0ACB9HYC8_9ASTR|nr:hypothetical protein L1987_35556 [Smallanthus sonchifolius]